MAYLTWITFLAWLSAAVMCWRLWLRMRRNDKELVAELQEAKETCAQLHALQLVLFECALQAFRQRHLPVWHAWSAMTGLSFRIDLVEDDERTGRQ